MGDVVHLERRGPVGWMTIDNPPANALSSAVLEQLAVGLSDLTADPAVRAAVLTGAGSKFFVAGADIGEFASDGADRTRAKIEKGQRLTLEMERCRLPLVAAINGFALGGGLELAMACDLRLCAAGARMGQPEILLGIIPGWGGTQRLPRLIGRGRALELLFSGEQIEAERALELGLVNRVLAAGELLGATQELAERLAAQAPLAVAAIKEAVAEGLDQPLEQGLAAELERFDRTFRSQDAREGVSAFVQKRRPSWSGS